MKNIALYISDIKYSLKEKDFDELSEILAHIEAVDIVDGWDDFTEDEQIVLFRLLGFDKKVKVFERLPFESQKEIIDAITSERLGSILNEMASDERVDLFEQLPNEEVSKLFVLMKEKEVEDVKELLEYAEDTAGGKMTTEFVSLKPQMTAKEALVSLQESITAKEVRNIYALYEVDEEGKLIGGISLQRLIASHPDDKIQHIAKEVDNIKINVARDQEDVARLFTHYDLLSAPVVDDNNVLLGVITIDDIVDVIHHEATEDITKMAGTKSEDIMSASVVKICKIRWPWLFTAWLGGLGAVIIIDLFEKTLMEAVAVAAFIPVIMGMGGNVGVQSATIVIRGLALGNIDLTKVGLAVFKEIRVGLALGVSYGLLLGLIAHFKFAGDSNLGLIGLVAGMGICLSMTMAATLGALLPVIFKKLGVDPAVATGPMITTAIDVVGLSAYFALATVILL